MVKVSIIRLLFLFAVPAYAQETAVPTTEPSEPTKASASTEKSWKEKLAETAGNLFLGSEKGAIFYAFDILTPPNEKITLTARLQRVKMLQGVPNITIGFFEDTRLIGYATTDEEGIARFEWTPPEIRDYKLVAQIVDLHGNEEEELFDLAPVPLLVAVRQKETPFVVIDLDHTVVESSFLQVLLARATPMPDSVDVTHRLAKQYTIIYLTHRPDLMTERSKSWLIKYGYPAGPLVVSKLSQAVGSSGKFKTARIAELQTIWPNIKIGIGDKLSDAQAYVDNGMTAYLIPYYKREADDMEDMAEDIEKLRGEGRLHVVSGWKQIEKGFFENQKFPPQSFADQLRKDAKHLQSSKKKKDD